MSSWLGRTAPGSSTTLINVFVFLLSPCSSLVSRRCYVGSFYQLTNTNMHSALRWQSALPCCVNLLRAIKVGGHRNVSANERLPSNDLVNGELCKIKHLNRTKSAYQSHQRRSVPWMQLALLRITNPKTAPPKPPKCAKPEKKIE